MDFVQRTRPAVSRRVGIFAGELRFVIWVTLGLMLITSIPTIFGYLSTPSDKWFSGVIYNIHDTTQYFSWMRESQERIFIENKLTSEPNDPIFLNLHWWIPGRFASLTGMTLPQVYQLYRLLSIPLLTLTIYAFSAFIFRDPARRRFSFLLALLTSGLGWLWIVEKQISGAPDVLYPTDVYTTAGNSFYVMMVSPPQAFATAITLLTLLLGLLAVHLGRFSVGVGAGILALFLGMGHIYDLVTVWALLAVFGGVLVLRDGWSWQRFWSLSVVVIISAPAALYFGWVSSSANPMWQQALAQYDNLEVFTPSPPHLIILLGFTFILALLGFTGIVPLKQNQNKELFIKIWFGVTLLLIYLPFHFRIMLLTGYQFPLAVMATWAIYDRLVPWVRERLEAGRWNRFAIHTRLIPAVFILAVLPTNLYLFAWRIIDLNRHNYPYYLYQSDFRSFQWLEANTDPDDVVLSSFEIGHYIPGFSGNKAFLSNAVMTMDFFNKYELVERFFGEDMTKEERNDFLHHYDIRYIFYGPAEARMGRYEPGGSSNYRVVFEYQNTKVYEVIQSRLNNTPILHAAEEGNVLLSPSGGSGFPN
jgi:hypothetical protein